MPITNWAIFRATCLALISGNNPYSVGHGDDILQSSVDDHPHLPNGHLSPNQFETDDQNSPQLSGHRIR